MSTRASLAGERLLHGAIIPEKYVRCLWYDQRHFLKKGVRSRDGGHIRIVSPGTWNTGRGPDFLGGVFRLGRRGTVCGDVEVHRRRHDWQSHAHRRDPAFGGVRLHVFLLDDRNGDRCTNYSGGPVTEICLRGQTRRGIGNAARAIDPRRYPYHAGGARGRCGAAARSGGGERLARFLRSAGKARLHEKAVCAGALACRHGGEQALYRLILETLGYSARKGAFIRLARCLPWKTLRLIARQAPERQRQAAIEAALLGAAGLIPATTSQGWDADSVRAWRRTARTWEALKIAHGLDELPPGIWHGAAQRPANSPPRRIAGISVLFARCVAKGLWREMMSGCAGGDSRVLETRMEDLLSDGSGSYWDARCAWGGVKLRSSLSLIGREHRIKIIANVLLPVLCSKGRRDAAHAIFGVLPAVEPDSRVKTMITRLVGGGAPFPRRWGMAAQQGMLHLHRHFCAKDKTGCLRCPLPELIARFPLDSLTDDIQALYITGRK
ncbi:MAG: DUF2851 family protein [Chlamydiota bacterium]